MLKSFMSFMNLHFYFSGSICSCLVKPQSEQSEFQRGNIVSQSESGFNQRKIAEETLGSGLLQLIE